MATEVGSSMVARSALIVDDTSVVRKVTTKLLSKYGLEVSSVTDGVEVVAMYEEGRGHFDLIVMDLEMPIMNGIEVSSSNYSIILLTEY